MLFKSLFDRLPRPLKIMDVGGYQTVWETINLVDQPDMHVTILNLDQEECRYQNVESVTGDARDMRHFCDCEFDIVYSNSVIEHVGTVDQMVKMASEVRRGGRRSLSKRQPVFPNRATLCVSNVPVLAVVDQDPLVQELQLGVDCQTA